ncbi:MAG: TIGR04013 family B12-binding domain/radical SAM domain-containing protein [Trueperaceae bacterium]
MAHHAFAFVEYSYNRYSIAVLTGALEADERMSDIDIHFLKSNPKNEQDAAFIDEALELAKRYEQLILGFSFHTPNVIPMAQTIGELKQRLVQTHTDNVILIAGGPHPSGDPLGTLEMGIDIVVVGEGETVLPALLEKLYSQQSYATMQGISYLENGTYKYTGKPKAIDLSDYPAFAVRHKRYSPIEIGRGCPWACKFCQTPFLMGGRMRYRSVESIVKYAKIAKEQMNIRDLRFITPVSFAYGSPDGRTTNPRAVEELLKGVSSIYGREHLFFGSFPSEVRPESVTPEMLTLVKKYCANDNIIIGAQSGSETMLDKIHRGHTAQDVLNAVKLILEFGFTANVDFIFGMPGETKEDIEASLDFMKQLTNMGARVHSHTFMPLVGTPLSIGKPGVVDEKTREMLELLRSKGLEYGHWKQQEVIAETTTGFVSQQVNKRQTELKHIKPLHRQ